MPRIGLHNRKRLRAPVILGAIALVLVLLGGIVIWSGIDGEHHFSHPASADGTVTSWTTAKRLGNKKRTGPSDVYPIIGFTAADGVHHTFKGPRTSARDVELGAHVDVEYDPASPGRARLAGHSSDTALRWLGTGFVAVGVVAGGIAWAVERASRRRVAPLPATPAAS